MKPRVYLETSFISYLSGRFNRDLVTLQRQLSSRRWWDDERSKFEMVMSEAVFQECKQGDPELVMNRERILEQALLLPLTEEVLELAEHLIRPSSVARRC